MEKVKLIVHECFTGGKKPADVSIIFFKPTGGRYPLPPALILHLR